MKCVSVLAVLSSLFALSLIGDTIELKTGERIEGAFKQATAAGAVIEVGGQPITIPLEKVKAIYFGSAPTRTATAPAPSDEAVDALRALRSVTGSGITYRDYSQRVLDSRVKVDRYLSSQSGDGPELGRAIRVAMLEYELASRAWRANVEILSDLWKSMGDTMQDPEVAKCPAVRVVTTLVDNSRPTNPNAQDRAAILGIKAPDRATTLGIKLANAGRDNLAPDIWACASAQVAEAERLLAQR